MAMLVGHLFSNVDLSQRGAQDRAGALFFMLTTQVMSSSASMRTFLAERAIAQHEARSALWAPLPYFLARSAAETLLQATAAAAFGAACYCLVGLAPTAAQFSFFLALVTLATLVAESYVVMVGTLLSDEKAAALVAPLLLALMMASGGFFVSHASTPPLFHALNTINLFRYAYAGLLRNELTGLSFRCAEHELVGPPRPPRAARLALRAARVRWPARVCPISTGEAALERMGVSDLTPAAACGALVLMGLAYRAAGYWALRRRFRSPLA